MKLTKTTQNKYVLKEIVFIISMIAYIQILIVNYMKNIFVNLQILTHFFWNESICSKKLKKKSYKLILLSVC